MRSRRPPALRFLLAFLCSTMAAESSGAIAASDNGPWLTALSTAFVVMDLSTGDVDGDGRDETLVCYREDVGRTEQTSGIVILAGKAPDLRPVFHVQLETLCEKVRANGRKVGILLSGNKQLVWTYGEQVTFRGEKSGLLGGMKAKASSVASSSNSAEKTIDGDLTTSWAEGTSGTGLGQTVTLQFARPVDVGMIGIFGGSGAGARAFFDSNRVHRGSLEAKTEADLGDAKAGVDFSSLGIESIGDRIEFNCENKPLVTYVRVDKKGVMELQFRIESVYLGDKKDDTHIAEIEVVPVLNLSDTIDRATQLKSRDDTKTGDSKGSQKVAVPDGADAVKKLDEGGRSVISDDDL